MLPMIRQLLVIWLALLAALASAPVRSQAQPYTSDIDIYARENSTRELPNVLILLDNTANWSSMFTREITAMVNTFNNLDPGKFRVGLMMFTETGGGNSNTDGAYVRAAIRDLTPDYKTRLGNLLNSLDVTADRSNSGKAGLAMAEAYRYFSGGAPYAGNNKNKTDYTGNTSGNAASNAIYALTASPNGNALASRTATSYRSPVSNACAGNYIIYISNGAAQDSNSDNTTASNLLSAAYTAAGQTRPANITNLSPNGSQSNMADEWARFMKGSAQAVTTFTLDVDPVTTGQGPGWSALLKSIASTSGGEYFNINSSNNNGADVANALRNIFNQIESVNSVFTSASLPVSANARGTYLNQVFMGVFRPDANADPRWRGNLKQYRFGYDPVLQTVQLVDANGNPAVGTSTFLAPTAVSYWTSSSTFFSNDPKGTPPSASDSPDGEVVEKGGVAQRLRATHATSQAGRKVYTCINCANQTNLATSTAAAFTTSNTALTNSLFGVSATAERDAIINWVRGANNVAGDPADLGPGGSVTVRPSIHGDVLHSRPAVVNYGNGSTPQVYVFYGANDGTLRAVNGQQTGSGAGEELWAFIPQEHLSKFKRLRDNTPEVRLSTTDVAATTTAGDALPRDYFVDGNIGVYQKLAVDGTTEKVHIYASMRRGGRFLYALDVTDVTQPKLLWKRSHADSGFSVLGQTWSEPKVTRIRGNTNPVVIMGAGYDSAAEDALDKTSLPTGTQTMGNAVLVLDAFTGDLLKKFDTARSVPADVALVDADFDGLVDRAYATDVGGNIYRIDFELTKTVNGQATLAKDPADWTSFTLASLATAYSPRKFFYPPDVVLTPTYAAILVGSGNRENPLSCEARHESGTGAQQYDKCIDGTAASNDAARDAFFTLYDTVSTRGTPPSGFSAITAAQLGKVGSTESTAKGCYIPMGAGEKVVTTPVTVAGTTYFSTNQPVRPAANSCSANLGTARAYAAPLFCKAATSNTRSIGGLPPSPVSGIVTITYTDSSGQTVEKRVPFIIGGTGRPEDPDKCKNSSVEGCRVKLNIPPTRTRKYWFTENPR